ncbi:hypothetical protein [Paraliobacillus sp. JSM ZJ581]|uniref:hypothetical protein n=1 Tax=Paraliobacillus sp. JSM ZJ581 TaxID=3342118 RepID=UPI0035A8443C
MLDYGLLNVGSLILGLIAWILPVLSLIQGKKQEYKSWHILAVFSLSACTISICFQILYNYYLVKIEDWAALMDTIGAVALASSVLVVVTILLNIVNLILFQEKSH